VKRKVKKRRLEIEKINVSFIQTAVQPS
jgi:hypothetical protein